MKDDTITPDEGNLRSSRASGSEILNNINSVLRNRQRQPSVQSQPTVYNQFTIQIDQYKHKIYTYGKLPFLIVLIPVIAYVSNYS
ncbi:unnamed protein product [Rhizophagus irregularis]|nr:unnamed protein product [Rhizophagus irregularis]